MLNQNFMRNMKKICLLDPEILLLEIDYISNWLIKSFGCFNIVKFIQLIISFLLNCMLYILIYINLLNIIINLIILNPIIFLSRNKSYSIMIAIYMS